MLGKLVIHTGSMFLFIISLLFLFSPRLDPLKFVKSNQVFVYLPPETLETQSQFSEVIMQNKKALPYQTKTETDSSKDACSEVEVKQDGISGEKVVFTKLSYYYGQKYEEINDKVEITKPTDRIIVKGSKKTFKTLNTIDGDISYWCKIDQVLATSYDSTCKGCDTVTAIGMKQGFGIVAVDPKVIPLRSRLYVPGYGTAIAGDTGGLIKGKHMDLGYDSLMGQWSRRLVDVYILN